MPVMTNLHCVVAVETASHDRRYKERIARRSCEKVEDHFGRLTNYSWLGHSNEFLLTLEVRERTTKRRAERLGRALVRALQATAGVLLVDEFATDYD